MPSADLSQFEGIVTAASPIVVRGAVKMVSRSVAAGDRESARRSLALCSRGR